MFWFRSDSPKKAIGVGLTYDDFDVPYSPDGTMMHAMERIYGLAAQDSGFYYADVINSDNARSDLVNYQYMLYGLVDLMFAKGVYPCNYMQAQEVIKDFNNISFRCVFKEKIKQITPTPIWNFLKKTYHLFGGKKWVG